MLRYADVVGFMFVWQSLWMNLTLHTLKLKLQEQPDWNAEPGTSLHTTCEYDPVVCSSSDSCLSRNQRLVQKWTGAAHPGERWRSECVKELAIFISTELTSCFHSWATACVNTQVSHWHRVYDCCVELRGKIKNLLCLKYFWSREGLTLQEMHRWKRIKAWKSLCRNRFYNSTARASYWSDYVEIRERHYCTWWALCSEYMQCHFPPLHFKKLLFFCAVNTNKRIIWIPQLPLFSLCAS